MYVCVQVIDELVDAEVCEVAKAARAILLKAMGEGLDKQADPASPTAADASCMYVCMYVCIHYESVCMYVVCMLLSGGQ